MTFEELATGECLAGLDGAEERGVANRSASDVERAFSISIKPAGDGPDREGLVATPARVARAHKEWFAGYAIIRRRCCASCLTTEDYDETVLLRNIPVASTCDHHLARRVALMSPIGPTGGSSAHRRSLGSSMPSPGCSSRNEKKKRICRAHTCQKHILTWACSGCLSSARGEERCEDPYRHPCLAHMAKSPFEHLLWW